MRIKEANIKLMNALNELYANREAKSISRIFWEDLFNYRGGIDRHLHSKEIASFDEGLSRLSNGEPVQYVTGISYFYDLKLHVSDDVLIPRPETEELVYLMLAENLPHSARILDVGSGSGCIPLALKSKRNDFEIIGLDKSPGAIKIAKINAEKNELKVRFDELDFLNELTWENYGLFDVIVSNPPYISQDERKEMSPSTLKFEPDMALFPEDLDVLIFYKKIAEFAREHLADGGRIFLECNEFNVKEVAALFQESKIVKDMQGKERFVLAQY